MNNKSASTSLRHDPSDWANKRKVAMERAKQLRESRFFQDDSKHTLKPDTNKQSQPPISTKNKDLDSLDEAVLAVGGSATDLSSNYDDRSLQSIGSGLSIENTRLKGKPPPHSGAVVSNHQRSISMPSNKNDDPRYRSKFMQQYDQERNDRQIDVNINRNGNLLAQNGKSVLAIENDSSNGYSVHQIKPSRKSVASTPSWNSDTTVQSINEEEGDQNGSEYNIAPPRGRNNRRNSDINNNRETGDKNGNYDSLPQPNHRNSDVSMDSEGSSVVRSRQEGSVGMAGSNSRSNVRALQSPVDKGRLSLLKSKVQRGRALRSRSAVVARKEQDSYGASGADNLSLNIPPGGAGAGRGAGMQHSPLPHSAPAPPGSFDDRIYPTKQPTNGNGNGNSGIPSRRKSAALNSKQTGFSSRQNPTISPYDEDDQGQEEEVPQKAYKDVRQNQRNIPAALLPASAPKHPSGSHSNSSPTSYQQNGYPGNDSNSSYNYNDREGEGEGEAEENVEDQDMNECPDCGRKFNSTAYPKHIKICKNVFMKKRKAFDIAQKRIEANPELVQILKQKARTGGKKGGLAQAAAKLNAEDEPINGGGQKAKWKAQSEAFRQALRAARQVTIAQESGKPLPPMAPSAPDPSLIQCPHCSRRFNEKAAERHIPQCQNIKARPSALKRGAGGGGGMIGGGSTGTTTTTTISSNRGISSIKENNPSNIPNKGSKMKRPR